METVYLSLGSNTGDRRKNLQEAIYELRRIFTNIRPSAIYESEPWGDRDRPWYLNIVLKGLISLSPEALFSEIQKIETQLGRVRLETTLYAPRTIDIDILFYGDRIVNAPELTIPHPHLTERLFVLIPLAELAPKFFHPVLKKTVWELLNECKDTSAVKQYRY